jgi:hypothetical protein
MGCEESRPTVSGGKNGQDFCYCILGGYYQGGDKDNMQLRQYDMIDFVFRNSTSIFGPDHVTLADRKIILDEKLRFE